MTYILGADIGGSHITCAAVQIDNSTLIPSSYSEEPVDSKSKDASSVLDAWSKAIIRSAEAVGKENVRGLGVAIPGPFDYVNGIALYTGENDKFTSLYNIDVKAELAQRTGIPAGMIFFSNDAACFGMGENWVGAGRGSNNMIGITLGTGFGAVFIKNGRHVTEGAGVPKGGELWDYSYKGTIAEDFVSTRWFIKRYNELSEKTVEGAYDVAKCYDTDSNSRQVFDEFAETLADILIPSLTDFQANSLVIGGSIAKSSNLFLDKLQAIFNSKGLDVTVVTAKLFDKAAILGAAKLVLNSL